MIKARLTAARKILQIDVGFGDVVVAGPLDMDFPVLLYDQPAPNLLVYSKESAIAEKFEAMVALNLLTSRMKDIYDTLYLAEREPSALATMRQAVSATFTRRETALYFFHWSSPKTATSRHNGMRFRGAFGRSRPPLPMPCSAWRNS